MYDYVLIGQTQTQRSKVLNNEGITTVLTKEQCDIIVQEIDA